MPYCDDFYEPSAFDEQVEEFKESLRKSVKEGFLAEMEKLRKENEELRTFRDQKEEIERQYKKAIREYEIKAKNAESDARRMRANEIVRDLCVVGYRPKEIYEERPKCDKCDENRIIHYISPMGRKCSEYCKCAKKIVHYEPKEVKLLRFYVNGRNSPNTLELYYEQSEGREHDHYANESVFEQSENQDFEKVSLYSTVFIEKSNCKAYCDWKNAKIKEKEINA